jgi:hypothetical protein
MSTEFLAELAAKLKIGMNVRLPDGKRGKIADAPYYAESLKTWCVCVWTTSPHERKQYWDGWTSLPCAGITIIEDVKPVKEANRAPLIQKPVTSKPTDAYDSLGYEPWWVKY